MFTLTVVKVKRPGRYEVELIISETSVDVFTKLSNLNLVSRRSTKKNLKTAESQECDRSAEHVDITSNRLETGLGRFILTAKSLGTLAVGKSLGRHFIGQLTEYGSLRPMCYIRILQSQSPQFGTLQRVLTACNGYRGDECSRYVGEVGEVVMISRPMVSDQWYRAEVLEISSRGRYELRLLDTGEEVLETAVHPLGGADDLRLPATAIRCKLTGPPPELYKACKFRIVELRSEEPVISVIEEQAGEEEGVRGFAVEPVDLETAVAIKKENTRQLTLRDQQILSYDPAVEKLCKDWATADTNNTNKLVFDHRIALHENAISHGKSSRTVEIYKKENIENKPTIDQNEFIKRISSKNDKVAQKSEYDFTKDLQNYELLNREKQNIVNEVTIEEKIEIERKIKIDVIKETSLQIKTSIPPRKRNKSDKIYFEG